MNLYKKCGQKKSIYRIEKEKIMAVIIDGKELAKKTRANLKLECEEL